MNRSNLSIEAATAATAATPSASDASRSVPGMLGGPPAWMAAERYGEDPLRALLRIVALILAVGVTVLVLLVAYFSHNADSNEIKTSASALRSAIEVRQNELAHIVLGLAWSDEAVLRLVRDPAPRWADAVLGGNQVETNSVDASFVVDGADRTVFAFAHGAPSRIDAHQALGGGLDVLLAYTRNSPRGALRAAAGLLVFGGRPQIAVACAITPQANSPAWPYDQVKSVIVLLRPLDPGFLARLGADFHIDNLRLLGAGPHPSAAALDLFSPDGTKIGTLGWQPALPASSLMVRLAPFIGVVALALGGLFWLFLRRVRRVGMLLARQAKIIEQAHDGVILTDRDGIITGWNAGATKMFGYVREEVLGKFAGFLVPSSDSVGTIAEAVRSFFTGNEHVDVEIVMRRKNGEDFDVELLLSPVTDTGGAVVGTIGYHIDISERKKLEAKLERLATVDELTGAFNRHYFLVQGPVELERARRFKRKLSLLFIDLDHFKSVNDRFGHAFGDLVLATFADGCRKVLRPSDMFVRYGGEEFVILLPESGIEQANAVATRLAAQLRQTVFSLDPPYRGLTISIGIAAATDADLKLETVIARADQAMYRAKQLGRDRIEHAN